MLLPELQAETDAVAQVALASIGAWEARDARPIVRGVCIDSDHSLDRDDAIWFTETADGKLMVDVTIADVASFISKGSLLDKRARKMVETEYGADTVIEPMFPFRLSQDDGVEGNGIFSLSDKSIRAGMTTRILLNPKNRVIENIEIFPSLIHPEVVNYKQVADDIESNPTGRFAQWAAHTKLLKRIRRNGNEGVLPINIGDDLNERVTHVSEEGHIQEFSKAESAASKMVEETALLANRGSGQFFAATGLPYLFRTHQVKLEGAGQSTRTYDSLSEADDARQALLGHTQSEVKLVLDRATYSPRRMPHAALGEYAYAHKTSPIRRYADIPNQRMEHWLAETVAELSYRISEALDDKVGTQEVTSYLSKTRTNPAKQQPLNGSKLIGWTGRLRMGERESIRRHCREKIHKYLVASLHELSPNVPLPKLHTLANSITQKLNKQIKAPPYTHAEMQELAHDINLNRASKNLTERERLAQKLLLTQMERQLELAELQVLNALEMENHQTRSNTMAAFSAEKRFPLTLHLAAQQGKEYCVPAAEILQRLQEGRLREPSDLATILVQMKLPTPEDAAKNDAFAGEESQAWLKENCENWAQVKEAILHRFAANPSFTKGFLKYLEERYHWQIHSTHATLIADGAIAATMSLNPQPDIPAEDTIEQTLFPPDFSIGHWGKTTRHHARLGLLRALANDNLVSSSDVKLPRALRLMTAAGYKEFTSADARTPEILQEKAKNSGITVTENWNEKLGQYELFAVSNASKKSEIRFIGEANTKQDARALAWQNMLRSKLMQPVQEALFRKREQLKAIPIDADDAIKWLGEHSDRIEQNLHLSSTNQYTQRREPIWQAKLSLKLGTGLSRQFIGESTQADVAGTFANEAGLRNLRDRADYGDKAIEKDLRNYEKQVLKRYAQGDELTSKVPYTARMNGRDITPTDHTPNKANGRG